MKKNNSGFTLIEITAVVLILGVIFLISFPTLERLMKKSEQDKDTYNEENIIMAAKTYLNMHSNEYEFTDGTDIEINLTKLVEDDLIDDNDYDESDKVVCHINGNDKECSVVIE